METRNAHDGIAAPVLLQAWNITRVGRCPFVPGVSVECLSIEPLVQQYDGAWSQYRNQYHPTYEPSITRYRDVQGTGQC